MLEFNFESKVKCVVTTQLNWNVYNVSISLQTVLVKKYTPCQGVVWSQYTLSGTFYVPNSIGKKIHTLPRCSLVTIQIVRHILCSINFWCGFVCQGVFFLTNAVLKSWTFYTGSIVALLLSYL